MIHYNFYPTWIFVRIELKQKIVEKEIWVIPIPQWRKNAFNFTPLGDELISVRFAAFMVLPWYM